MFVTIRRLGMMGAIVLMVLFFACVQPAAAQDAGSPTLEIPPLSEALSLQGGLQPWQRTLFKTVTFQAVANATDVLLFDLVVGAHPIVLSGFFVANAATAAGLYYGFEYLWQDYGPPLEETNEITLAKKSVIFQAVNSGRIFALGYGLGAGTAAAATLAGAVFFTDTAVYFANEYVWDILRPISTASTKQPLTASSVLVSAN